MNDLGVCLGCTTPGTCTPACAQWDLDGDATVTLADFALYTGCPNLPLICPGGSIDHYKVYNLDPEVAPIPGVLLADQFGTGLVNLTNLGKLGLPVSKAHAPNPPSGVLLRPDEHLSWYEFFEPKALQLVRVKNQFESEAKGAIWTISDAQFLLVPAIKDGGVANGGIRLEQHWKCYNAAPFFNPSVTVNLLDQFHLEANVIVGSGRYLCNPVEKNSEGPPSFPEGHLACYGIPQDPFGGVHVLDDQFGNHPGLVVENPEMLCLPSIKYLPEPGALLSFGSGLMLLGWLDRRRRQRAIGR